ncbi:conserved hypothetical protein [Neospora caninum Liverpool]|uniref:Uncharacterized protein n=1 Tax=Neospora caninum (strain Liverpool) TaxID=572307 RepID=F0VB40_NEOCL|nr:conserved hypothetical protein [Neospora caninum Liverpool]CBZ50862.1 conserved hypothetical protein [Neospora caninum Liverpool]CEL68164.1 TPA: hypothetical protein BN1204_039370 [Neospora caninum Liverpool]|eukprot:XP_003880895.1 conserved hypothetical protein [Neospora caninum Liverpool]
MSKMNQVRAHAHTEEDVGKRVEVAPNEGDEGATAEKNADDLEDKNGKLDRGPASNVDQQERGEDSKAAETELRHEERDQYVRKGTGVDENGGEHNSRTAASHSTHGEINCDVKAGDLPSVTEDKARHSRSAETHDTTVSRAGEDTEKIVVCGELEPRDRGNAQEGDGGNEDGCRRESFEELQQGRWKGLSPVETETGVREMPYLFGVVESNSGKKRWASSAEKLNEDDFPGPVPPLPSYKATSFCVSTVPSFPYLLEEEVETRELGEKEPEGEHRGRSKREFQIRGTQVNQKIGDEQTWQQDQTEVQVLNNKKATDGGDEKINDFDSKEEYLDATDGRGFVHVVEAVKSISASSSQPSTSVGFLMENQEQERSCGTIKRGRERGRQLCSEFHSPSGGAVPAFCRFVPPSTGPSLSFIEKQSYFAKESATFRSLSRRWTWPDSSFPWPILGRASHPRSASASTFIWRPPSSPSSKGPPLPERMAMASSLAFGVRRLERPPQSSACGAELSLDRDVSGNRKRWLRSCTIGEGMDRGTSRCGWSVDDPTRNLSFLKVKERVWPPTTRQLGHPSRKSVPLQLETYSSFIQSKSAPRIPSCPSSFIGKSKEASSTPSKLFKSPGPLLPLPKYQATNELLDFDRKEKEVEFCIRRREGRGGMQTQQLDEKKGGEDGEGQRPTKTSCELQVHHVTERGDTRKKHSMYWRARCHGTYGPAGDCKNTQRDDPNSTGVEGPQAPKGSIVLHQAGLAQTNRRETEDERKARGLRSNNAGHMASCKETSWLGMKVLIANRAISETSITDAMERRSQSRGGSGLCESMNGEKECRSVRHQQSLTQSFSQSSEKYHIHLNTSSAHPETKASETIGKKERGSFDPFFASHPFTSSSTSVLFPCSCRDASAPTPGGRREEVNHKGHSCENENWESAVRIDEAQALASKVHGLKRGRSPGLHSAASKLTVRKLSHSRFACFSSSPSPSSCRPRREPKYFQRGGQWKKATSAAVTERAEEKNRIFIVEEKKQEKAVREQEVQTEDVCMFYGGKKEEADSTEEMLHQVSFPRRYAVSLKKHRNVYLKKQSALLARRVRVGQTLKSSSRNRADLYAPPTSQSILIELWNQALDRVEVDNRKREEHDTERKENGKTETGGEAAVCFGTAATASKTTTSLNSHLVSQSIPFLPNTASLILQVGRDGRIIRVGEGGRRVSSYSREPRATSDGKADSIASIPSQGKKWTDEEERTGVKEFEEGWEAFGIGEALWESNSSGPDRGSWIRIGKARTEKRAVSLTFSSRRPTQRNPSISECRCSRSTSIRSSFFSRSRGDTGTEIDTKTGHGKKFRADEKGEMEESKETQKQSTGRGSGNSRTDDAHIEYTEQMGNMTHQECVECSNLSKTASAKKANMKEETEGQMENAKKKNVAKRRKLRRSARAREIEAARGLEGKGKDSVEAERGSRQKLMACVRKVSSPPAITSRSHLIVQFYGVLRYCLVAVSITLRSMQINRRCFHPKDFFVIPKKLDRPFAFVGLLDAKETQTLEAEGTPVTVEMAPSPSPSNRLLTNAPPSEEDTSDSRSTSSGERTAASSSDSLKGLLELWLEEGDKIAREARPPKDASESPASRSIPSPASCYGLHLRRRHEPRQLCCPPGHGEQNGLPARPPGRELQHWEGQTLFAVPHFAGEGGTPEAGGHGQGEEAQGRGDGEVGSGVCAPAVLAVSVVHVNNFVSVADRNHGGQEVAQRHRSQGEEAHKVEQVFSPSGCSSPSCVTSASAVNPGVKQQAKDEETNEEQPPIFSQPREGEYIYAHPPLEKAPTSSFSYACSPVRPRGREGNALKQTGWRSGLCDQDSTTRLSSCGTVFSSKADAMRASADSEQELRQSLSQFWAEAKKLEASFDRIDRLRFALERLQSDREQRQYRMAYHEEAALRPPMRKVQFSAQFQSRRRSISSEEESSEGEEPWLWQEEPNGGRVLWRKAKAFITRLHPAQWCEYMMAKLHAARHSDWETNDGAWSWDASPSRPRFRQRAKTFLHRHLLV